MQRSQAVTKNDTSLKPLYVRQIVSSLGTGMVNPFMGAYAVELGASTSAMGWFQSSSNISNNVMQVFWGRLSDKLKRRIPFIVLGSLILSVLWVPMIFVANATQLIMILAIQALIGSMATPTWTALIGDLVPTIRLGRANASITLWASIGGVLTTLASGFLMVSIHGTVQEIFVIPLMVASVSGIVSSLVMLRIRENKNGIKLNLKEIFTSDIISIVAYARKTPSFQKYCYAVATFQFFMSIAWPILAVTQIRVLNASLLQIAVLSAVQTATSIAFQNWAGRLSDTIGRRPLLLFFRFSFITVPLAYALVPNMNTLIVVSVFWGFSQALGSASETVYLLDVTPEEHRGSFAAIFNLLMGMVTFVGSLMGGYIADFTTTAFGLVAGLQIVYVISLIGRGIGAGLHLSLKETLKK